MDAGASWPAGKRGPLNLRAAGKDGACGLHLRFRPRLDETGTLRIRVQPKITVSRSAGVASRKMDTEIEVVDGQSFLVSGLTAAADWPVLARFFPGQPAEGGHRELLVWVTPQIIEPVGLVAAAGR
jgi:Flp pilus assembly secretin CpaC